jgi:hypothetical protein
MKLGISAIERAFELARSGRFDRVDYIRNKLRSEGYFADQVAGRALLALLSVRRRML